MILFNDISLRIAGRLLIDHATAAIPDGARVGMVGRNGAGKTTLFRAITGDTALESGDIRIPNGARIGQVAQEAPAGPERLIDVVLAADTERASLLKERESATDAGRIAEIELRLVDIDAHAAPARAARILSGLGFDEAAQQRPCSEFSGGWRMRVALAAILFAEPDLLLLDEPTNYLDLEGTLWLQDYLARYPRTVLIVSHDRELLNESVSFILHLDQGKLTLWRGGYDSFERQRADKQAVDQKARAKQEAKRKHMEAFVERFRAKATKARQAQSRLKALARMAPIAEMVGEAAAAISIRHPERIPSPPILTLDGVSAGYDGRAVLKGLTLRIDHDDRIALLGPNGNGKSTFAKLISGRLAPLSGSMVRAAGLEIAYLAQHQLDELVAAETVYDHVRRLMPDAPEAKVRSRAAEMGFSGPAANTTISALSGGEKARLLLGLAAFHGPHLLILDEPTNHLDIAARQALTEAINDFPGAVILISHDRSLLDASAERLWLVAEGTVRPYEGDLDEYQKLVVGRTASAQRKEAGGTRADERRQAADRRAETAPLRRKIKDAEAAMAKLEGRIAAFDAKLADESLYVKQPAEAQRLARERAEAASALARVEEEWLEHSAALDAAMA
ncbi:ABC-F family ATP-binding cassette domain-containing protein [Starkeya koreensis]|uniref:ABC-F family ATP-binding cassette domain-containing protein n=1 Tax=Ancylobacter koreensis TaxID=266121 RepID=A0ABT0DNA9_9HYPH|nr:ABC-F family ATP-binding cassette domain-containing protein [Ancylobacter koreensis]MCK0208758.1 ABC-F family ATP-binding cassette domain-containing protein [Ancylobacter koreensis]